MDDNHTAIPAGTRCDACIARASVQATMSHNRPLYFCGHHYRHHETALNRQATAIKDERTPQGSFIATQHPADITS